YWPYATTLYDYLNRAMPLTAPGSLKPDEVYGLVAFLLWRNEIITDTAVMDAQTLPRVVMPARARFVVDNRRGGPEIRQRRPFAFSLFWRHESTPRCLRRPDPAGQWRRPVGPARGPLQGPPRCSDHALRDVGLPVPLLPRLRPGHHAFARTGIHQHRQGPPRLHQPATHEPPPQRAGRRPGRPVRGPAGPLLGHARPVVPTPGRMGQTPQAFG